ncbi:putative transcription factor Trihelix family [Helianthus anomalus]
MEGNLSSSGISGGSFDFQRVHHQQGSMMLPCVHENFPFRIGSGTIQDSNRTVSLAAEFGKGETRPMSCEDDPSFTEEDGAKNVNMNFASPWQRVKWNDQMVRLLITAVSYIGEDAEYGSRRKFSSLQKKGKWKSVSKVMAERGHFVSPQQCEDKFNDLNKRYKRLNEILGRGTSCEVVENPSLLDLMDHVPEKLKEEVRKILSSKHLHYEEMCSYHNGNRLHLPPDPELQHSLRLALRARNDHEINDGRHEDPDDDDDQDPYVDLDHDEYDEYHRRHHHQGVNLGQRTACGVGEGSSKRVKQNEDSLMKNVQMDMDQEGMKSNLLQDQWLNNRLLQLEEQKVHIQAQMLELEKERFKWQRFRRKKDTELEMMRIDNERMKMENDQMLLELKRKAMSADLNQ